MVRTNLVLRTSGEASSGDGRGSPSVTTSLVGKCPRARGSWEDQGLDARGGMAHHADIAIGISMGIQMSELMRLLVKAVRSLPQDEQDTVLTELLGALGVQVLAGRLDQPSGQSSQGDPAWASLASVAMKRLSLGWEAGEPLSAFSPQVRSGGPWQTVPTRLSIEQYERLKQWCQANGFTMAVVLRGLVERFLEEQGRRSKPSSGDADEASA